MRLTCNYLGSLILPHAQRPLCLSVAYQGLASAWRAFAGIRKVHVEEVSPYFLLSLTSLEPLTKEVEEEKHRRLSPLRPSR
jgi:hypothetical protein